jgi:hypothetical protein
MARKTINPKDKRKTHSFSIPDELWYRFKVHYWGQPTSRVIERLILEDMSETKGLVGALAEVDRVEKEEENLEREISELDRRLCVATKKKEKALATANREGRMEAQMMVDAKDREEWETWAVYTFRAIRHNHNWDTSPPSVEDVNQRNNLFDRHGLSWEQRQRVLTLLFPKDA